MSARDGAIAEGERTEHWIRDALSYLRAVQDQANRCQESVKDTEGYLELLINSAEEAGITLNISQDTVVVIDPPIPKVEAAADQMPEAGPS